MAGEEVAQRCVLAARPSRPHRRPRLLDLGHLPKRLASPSGNTIRGPHPWRARPAKSPTRMQASPLPSCYCPTASFRRPKRREEQRRLESGKEPLCDETLFQRNQSPDNKRMMIKSLNLSLRLLCFAVARASPPGIPGEGIDPCRSGSHTIHRYTMTIAYTPTPQSQSGTGGCGVARAR